MNADDKLTRVDTCDKCGTTAEVPAGAVLPPRWEFYRASRPDSPLWCGECVDKLLVDVESALRAAAKAGRF